MASLTEPHPSPSAAESEAHGRIWGVIAASSTGTIIEWYDFYIFGSLASTISQVFYPETNATISLLKWLATFAVGFAVRPSARSSSGGSATWWGGSTRSC